MLMRATKRAGEAPKIKTLRENEASFDFLVETIATPIFISRGERLHYVNHAAEVLTGYSRKELLSMNFWDLIPPESREPVGIAGTTLGCYRPAYRPGQLSSAPRCPPRRDRTIRAHGTTVRRLAARLGWAEEDQRLLRPLGRQPGTMPHRRGAPSVLSGYRHSRAIRGRRVCRRAARDSGRSRRACRVSHSQSACNG